MQAPDFWWRPSWQAPLLAPAGCLYALGGRLRRRLVTPLRPAAPVICIGNLVAGGAGKTPTALAVAERLLAFGLHPAFLSRGYGGRQEGPLLVDPARQGAAEVGDEPLLLARLAPCIVARDRKAGAGFFQADVLVMDDGFQNPSLDKTLSLLVIDGGQGLGNGRVLPAGPLREPLADGLARADAVVLIGEDRTGVASRLAGRPLLRAGLVPRERSLAGQRVLAFAGIGRPGKFFESLRVLGAEVAETRAFADHHVYGDAELEALRDAARATGARLVTTEKDLVRLLPQQRIGIETLAVDLVFADRDALDRLLRKALALA